MSKWDWIAPIWGTVVLQPFAYIYCIWAGVDYVSTLGPFTILSTLYLMPMYALYWWGVNKLEEKI